MRAEGFTYASFTHWPSPINFSKTKKLTHAHYRIHQMLPILGEQATDREYLLLLWLVSFHIQKKEKKTVCASSLNQQDTYISFCGWTWTSPRVNLVKGCWLLYGSIVSVALPPLW
jgi:hypothetical protein